MRFKAPTHEEEIGDPVAKYSVNYDISLNQPLFRKGGKKIRLLLGVGEDGELNPNNSEPVGRL